MAQKHMYPVLDGNRVLHLVHAVGNQEETREKVRRSFPSLPEGWTLGPLVSEETAIAWHEYLQEYVEACECYGNLKRQALAPYTLTEIQNMAISGALAKILEPLGPPPIRHPMYLTTSGKLSDVAPSAIGRADR